MRRALAPLAVLLALATGFVVAETRLVALAPVGTARPNVSHATANAEIVHRFYDAANEAIRSGDASPLTHLVADEFVEHAVRPGLTPDRAGLLRYLRALHGIQPALRLAVREHVAEGDHVATLVEVRGTHEKPGVRLPTPTEGAWGTTDVFRLRAGRIVEHWGDDEGQALVEPLLSVTIPVEPPTAKVVAIERRTYPAGATEWHAAGAPTILLVETGTLTVALSRNVVASGSVVRAPGAARPLPPGEEATLSAGEALVLHRASDYRVRNDGQRPAVSLAIGVRFQGDPHGADPDGTGLGGPPATQAHGVTREVLIEGPAVELAPGLVTITVGRVALALGAGLAPHRVATVELAVVAAGRFVLSVEGGPAWVQDPTTPAIGVAGDIVVAAGQGVHVAGGTTVDYRSVGGESLELLLVTIGPDADDRYGSTPHQSSYAHGFPSKSSRAHPGLGQ